MLCGLQGLMPSVYQLFIWISPLKDTPLFQTIARANRVYDDEKENGLIVDYGNVYKQLEQAYSIYGEGSKELLVQKLESVL